MNPRNFFMNQKDIYNMGEICVKFAEKIDADKEDDMMVPFVDGVWRQTINDLQRYGNKAHFSILHNPFPEYRGQVETIGLYETCFCVSKNKHKTKEWSHSYYD
eukprot:171630_1